MMKQKVKNILKKMGYEINRIPKSPVPIDMTEEDFIDIYRRCRPYSMVSVERMYALYQAVAYVTKHDIDGDFVECGVWKGGSSMFMAHALLKRGDCGRRLYLYDTYAGMSRPQDIDVRYTGEYAMKKWQENQAEGYNKYDYAPLEEVTQNLFSTGYPHEKLVFVKGKVEDTIPGTVPDKIAILRLDSDWYESTYHELKHLFPRLVTGGVLIIDDYGCWKGAREAVDQYLRETDAKILLNRIDYTGRSGIKTDL